MPSRNVLKPDVEESFYHAYARGVNKAAIFHHAADYEMFLGLLKRYLSGDKLTNKVGVPYPEFKGKIELICYCLMPNHIHLLFYQIDKHAMAELMRAVMTSYAGFYNKKYRRTGPLFESRYKASLIDDDGYLTHISRYIHLNPNDWESYKYSSLNYFFKYDKETWILPGRVEKQFTDRNDYLGFLLDYENQKVMLEEIKHELATVDA